MCTAIFGTLSFFALRLAFHRGCGMGLWWLQPPPCSGHCSRDRGEVGQGWWPISSSVGLKLGSKRTTCKSTSPQVCLHFVFKVGKLSLEYSVLATKLLQFLVYCRNLLKLSVCARCELFTVSKFGAWEVQCKDAEAETKLTVFWILKASSMAIAAA